MRSIILARGGVVMVSLSERQTEVYGFIKGFINEHGYPPTHEEIRQGLGMSTKSLVSHHLKSLERKGLIERERDISRGINIPGRLRSFKVPLLGHIAAGEPISFSEEAEEEIELTPDIVREQEGLYALRVKGDSMMDALINDGDIVVMRHQKVAQKGEMVAVRLKDTNETTLKKFHPEGKRVRLQPANPRVKPIYIRPAKMEIQGKVMAVIRQME
jgi:repressor LexA